MGNDGKGKQCIFIITCVDVRNINAKNSDKISRSEVLRLKGLLPIDGQTQSLPTGGRIETKERVYKPEVRKQEVAIPSNHVLMHSTCSLV